MARQYKAGLLITGDAKGAVQATKLTQDQLKKLNTTHKLGAKYAKQHASAIGGLTSMMKGLLPVIGVAAFGSMIKGSIDAADKIQKLSIRIGASTEALSQYQHVADLSGVSFQTLTSSMERLGKRTALAAQEMGPANKAFKQLNIDAKEWMKLRPEEQFERLADVIANTSSSSEKLAIASQFLGDEGRSLIQVMDGGSKSIREMREEADQLGLTLSRDQADAAAAANDAMTRLGAA